MKKQRVEELLAAMPSFSKESYQKSELLNEMFALQKEIVELTFSENHAAIAELKIWDVEKHLEQLNQECGHIADEDLASFIEQSKVLCNLIRAEISGNRGEYKAFKTLEYLKSKNKVLKNVELSDGEFHTELDAVVITPKCVTIVEVKNTAKNIFIDEDGNYFRTGEFLRWDSNIAEKMAIKEDLLRKVLDAGGYEHIQIKSIVVFTNNRIEVQNKYNRIRTTFVSQLAHIIDGYRLNDVMNADDLNRLEKIIKDSECKEAYPFEFDVQKYKNNFANLMATLEAAKQPASDFEDQTVVDIISNAEPKGSLKPKSSSWIKTFFKSKQFRLAGSTAAFFALTVASGIIVTNTVNKGGF